MPTLRNPFRKQDENVRPTQAVNGETRGVNGSATKPVDIVEKEPKEYKLSEINDSGVFVPPSPPERKTFWTTSSTRSTTSSTRPSLFGEDEPFNISRESFDSYRRSFDISARSPVIPAEARPRASLDSRTFQPLPRASASYNRPVQAPLRTQQEEDAEALEDVPLEDAKPAAPKKRGVFSRIMDGGSSSSASASGSSDPHHPDRPPSADGATKSSWHHFGARKRGQSGQGSELGSIPKADAPAKPESSLRAEVKAPVAAPVAATAPPATAPPATAAPPTPMNDSNKSVRPVADAALAADAAKVDS